jgi:hypothetical protein
MTRSSGVRVFRIDDPTHQGDPDGLIAAAALAVCPIARSSWSDTSPTALLRRVARAWSGTR